MFLRSKTKGVSHESGFTLIELLVTVVIMVVITSIVVSNDSTYSERTSLRNAADNVALAVREAQTYGISVRETSTGSGNFDTAYGVEFNATGSNSKYFILYSDTTVNGQYDGTNDNNATCTGGECRSVSSYGANTVNKICYIPINGNGSCPNGQSAIRQLDVTFKRPNTSTDQIRVFSNANNWQSLTSFLSGFGTQGKGVCIWLKSPAGLDQYVNIYTTGQISVDTQCR